VLKTVVHVNLLVVGAFDDEPTDSTTDHAAPVWGPA
jgi:hypothetical protein